MIIYLCVLYVNGYGGIELKEFSFTLKTIENFYVIVSYSRFYIPWAHGLVSGQRLTPCPSVQISKKGKFAHGNAFTLHRWAHGLVGYDVALTSTGILLPAGRNGGGRVFKSP